MRTHLRITALLFLLTGLVCATIALAGPSLLPSTVARLAAPGTDEALLAAAMLDSTGRTLTIAAAVVALPALVCGAAILSRRGWARWLGIPLAAVALVYVPIGTLLGGYVLWVLLARRFEPWFDDPDTSGF